MATAVATQVNLATARWIFLRGLAREAAHWGPFLDVWRAHLPGAEIVTPDLPGCGVHHRDRSPATVSEIVELIRAEIGSAENGAAGIARRPTAVFAMSLGAMVAYDWLRRYPGEVDGLVLVNGSIGGISPLWRRLRWFGIWSIFRASVAVRPETRERHILAMVSRQAFLQRGSAGGAGGPVAAWADIAKVRPVTRANALRQLIAAARFRPAFPPLIDHALVLASLGDRMVNPLCSRQIAAGMGAELREHPTAGHDLPLDAPDWVVAAVADWARSRLGAGAPNPGAL